MAVLVVVLVASLVAMAASFYLVLTGAAKDQQQLQLSAEMRALSYRLTSLSRESTAGDEKAFGELSRVVASMDGTWQTLRNANAGEAMMEKQYGDFEQVWQRVKRNAGAIVTNKDTIIFLNDVASTLNQSLPELQLEHNNIVEILLESRAPADQVAVAQMQSWRAERIGRNVDKMLRGGADAMDSADQFNLDANLFGKVLGGMSAGDSTMSITQVTDPDAIESLAEIKELFDFVSSSVKEIFEASPALFKARQAADALLDDSPVLLETLSELSSGIDSAASQRQPNNITIAVFALISVISMVIIGAQLLRAARKRLEEEAETNERNQQAIQRLLDEIIDLADGDLTTEATVTGDFTGVIADSINYTVDQLRILVSNINETSVEVSSAAQNTQQTALHLAEASEHQAQEIAGASAAVNEMAVTIDQVSVNAAESAGVAERSVTIASKGAEVVQDTIEGMDTIREQIQDTSKRIKRLGESSQEIGDIISLINDIADQTNILALNAAIQASMAGDAGRGFAVVADEVQRLAERSTAATKQIESLVKAIQNDTNEAVTSMEQTTTEVVKGARLAQDAGVALEEIESVSSNLAELIQSISNAARQQASSAGHISNTMNVIQEITSQTSSGTSATAQSIGNLADMATDLRESVAGFTLPVDGAGAGESIDIEQDPQAITEELDLELEQDQASETDNADMLAEVDEFEHDSSFGDDLDLDDSAATDATGVDDLLEESLLEGAQFDSEEYKV